MQKTFKVILGVGVLVGVLLCAHYFGHNPIAASVSIVGAALCFVALLAMIGKDEPNEH